MLIGKEISIASRNVDERREEADHKRLRRLWLAALAVSGPVGIGCGIVGLLSSFLAAEGVIPASSAVRLVVPILIVSSLTLLMLTAHALDRLHSLKNGK